MATKEGKRPRKQRPGITIEERENQLIGLAVDLAEQKLLDGTASNQLIVHYLKLGSTKERLEREMMEEQKKLLEAKTEALQSQKRVEELYANAIDAMRSYRSSSLDSYEEDV